MGRSQRSLPFQFFLTVQCPLPSQPCSDCFSTLVINPVFVSPLTQTPESGGGVAAEEGTDKKSGKRRWTGAAGRQPWECVVRGWDLLIVLWVLNIPAGLYSK